MWSGVCGAVLAERLLAKMNRKFDVADRIRDELKGMGVSIDDQTRQWTTDGGQGSKARSHGRDLARDHVQVIMR